MAKALSENDPNSFSNPECCLVTDMNIHLEVDFKKHILSGYVDLTVERKDLKADLILDTKDLNIIAVKNRSNSNKMAFTVGEQLEIFGSKLEIKMPKRGAKKTTVRIEYETSPKSSALQWLEPGQTAGKKHPYMFSMCQAIHARSLIPCQDSPGVKAPYSATITAPYELVVLMSALRDGETIAEDPLTKNYKFVQKIPIPSYLIAIVIGALESREIGPRSHVWSEKEFIEQAAEEFSETEKILKVAEDLMGEYVWGIYDLLVLPPSFSYGGMENPCLTFVTPTLLCGDKSQIDTIAHEIAHSWTGNLVTNKNFEHFWLNEGFTEFMERKILGRLHGDPMRHFHSIEGWHDLCFAVETLGDTHPYTKLVPDLKGVDPDDSFSIIPYEKGYAFLFYLETILGGPDVFEKFIKAYIEEYKYQSIDSNTWKSFLYKYFSEKEDVLNKVDWDGWMLTAGLPPVKPHYDTSQADKCIALKTTWLSANDTDLEKFAVKDIDDFSAVQIKTFLSYLLLEEQLSIKKIEKLNEIYKLGERRNTEIRFIWVMLCLKSHWKDIVEDAVKFITEQGRMKYVRPIYRSLHDWDETRDIALSTFKDTSPGMMYATQIGIRRDLQLDID